MTPELREMLDAVRNHRGTLRITNTRGFADKLEAAIDSAIEQAGADFKALASATRKMLPPELLVEIIAHLDPLTPFVAFLRDETDKGATDPARFKPLDEGTATGSAKDSSFSTTPGEGRG